MITQLVSMNDDNGKKINIDNINRFGASYQDLLDEIADLKVQLNIASNKYAKLVFSDNSELYSDAGILKYKDPTNVVKAVSLV